MKLKKVKGFKCKKCGDPKIVVLLEGKIGTPRRVWDRGNGYGYFGSLCEECALLFQNSNKQIKNV